MSGFPISEQSPVLYPGPPPDTAEVAVIGGGVIGVSTALYLAEAGHQVVLVEKGRIAGEQSSRNWGWIRQQGRDPDELPIMVEARQRWLELAALTNVDFGLRQRGVCYLAKTAAQVRQYEDWLPHAQACGVDSRILDGADVAALIPDMAQRVPGAIYTPSDMRAEPWLAVPAMAEIAVRFGARLVENCAVRMLDIAAGRVAGVVTEAGRIKTSTVVLAGGAWSALFLRYHGVNIPQLSVRESVVATDPLPEVFAGAAELAPVAFRRRADGGYTLSPGGYSELFIGPDAFRALPKYLPQLKAAPFGQGYLPAAPRGFPDAWGTPRRWAGDEVTPFERMRVLDPKPNARHIRKLVKNFAGLFPGLPPIRLKASWGGMIDTMPDIVPVVDHCAKVPGLIIGTGMSGHGFGIGPEMGRILGALATDENVGHDLTRFSANRFTDGSKIKLGPAL